MLCGVFSASVPDAAELLVYVSVITQTCAGERDISIAHPLDTMVLKFDNVYTWLTYVCLMP